MAARIAIAGGGPTGLMMARLLAGDGHDVDVFEAGPEIGGLCRSRETEGYTFDLAGGHIMFTRDERVARFWDSLYEEDEGCETHERRTRIYHARDHFVSYPFENALGELPVEDNIECTEGTIRAYLERAGSTAPKDFEAWIRWKMGAGVAKHFMEPYNQKIWKADLSEMGTSWIEGRVPDAPVEDILRASLGETTEGYTHQSVFRYPARGGFADVHERIARPVIDRVQLNRRVERLERTADAGWLVDGERYDHVVSTLPLHVLPDVITGMDAGAAEAARNLQYRGVASYLVGVEREEVRPYSWVYLPHPWQGPANRITYLSNYAAANAPEGKGSILAEVTYQPDNPPDITPAGQRALAEALAAGGLLDADKVTVTDGALNRVAYILYDIGFEAKRRAVLDWTDAQEGLWCIGRFGRYEYHNSDQCLARSIDLHAKMRPILANGGGAS